MGLDVHVGLFAADHLAFCSCLGEELKHGLINLPNSSWAGCINKLYTGV